MKTGYLLALVASSFSLGFVGAAFRVMHWTGSSMLLLLSALCMSIAGGLLILRLLLALKSHKP